MLENFFQKNKKYFLSLVFFPFLYFIGWILISLLINFFPVLQSEKSLLGTVFTFLIFFFSLPSWGKFRWNKNTTDFIGIFRIRNSHFIYNLFLEFIKAIIIISIITICLLYGGFAKWSINISKPILLNVFFLAAFVGLAEELVFRVWLFEELSLFFNPRISNIVQGIIFGLVHLRWDYGFENNIQMFIGLFLLGQYLNSWRNKKFKTILTPILFHSSLVGIWFFINQSLLYIQPNFPKLLFGPGEGNNLNPIGGAISIFILLILNYQESSNGNNIVFKK